MRDQQHDRRLHVRPVDADHVQPDLDPQRVGSTTEKTKRVDVLGPVTTKFKGEFSSVTANTSGQWDTHSATNLSGTLLDTESTTTTREITMN